MKIIDKYLFRNLLVPLTCTLAGFTVLFIIGDLFDKMQDFLDGEFGLVTVLRYYGLTIPSLLVIVIPVCILLSALFSLARLTRHGEITAMRAGGIGILRIARPFLLIGLFGTAATWFFNEYLAPGNAYRAEQLLDYYEKGADEEVYCARALAVKTQRHHRDWFIERFDTRDYSMDQVTVTQQHPDRRSTKYHARQVLRIDGRWWFMDLATQEYDDNGNIRGAPQFELQREMSEFSERPSAFLSEIKPPEFMSSSELRKYIRYNPQLSPQMVARKNTDMHHKLATPLLCLIAAMLGIPVGTHSARRGVFPAVLLTLALFFSLYMLQLTGQALSKSMLLDPAIAVWSPVLLFLLIGSGMLYRLR